MIRNILIFAAIAMAYGQISYVQDQRPLVLQRPQSQPAFQTPPRQPSFAFPAPRSFPAPAFQQSFSAPAFQQSFTSAPVFQLAFTSPILPRHDCDPIRKPLVDEVHNGRAYHFSWCHNSGRKYTWYDASHYCSNLGNGFQAVSIEDQTEDNFISGVLSTQNIDHIWTSGNKLASYYWTWASNVNTGYTNWSHTGRRGQPQPDNDEQNENCLAVLNNHYNDGIKWHDSRCDALKHVICEARQFYH